jgi:hypothetical protein
MPIAKNLTGSGDSPQQATNTVGDVANNLVAAGTTQLNATPFFAAMNVFRTVPASAGGILRFDLGPGDEQEVSNYGANALSVYPPVGGSIANAAVNTAFSLATNTTARFRCIDGLNFTVVS